MYYFYKYTNIYYILYNSCCVVYLKGKYKTETKFPLCTFVSSTYNANINTNTKFSSCFSVF